MDDDVTVQYKWLFSETTERRLRSQKMSHETFFFLISLRKKQFSRSNESLLESRVIYGPTFKEDKEKKKKRKGNSVLGLLVVLLMLQEEEEEELCEDQT